jgi:hypothetical protein
MAINASWRHIPSAANSGRLKKMDKKNGFSAVFPVIHVLFDVVYGFSPGGHYIFNIREPVSCEIN